MQKRSVLGWMFTKSWVTEVLQGDMTQNFYMSKHLTHSFTVMMLITSAFVLDTAASASAAELPPDWQERIKVGVHAYETGDNRGAFDRFSKLMTEGEAKFGVADGRMVRLYTNMGEVYTQQGMQDYAIQCLKRALSLADKGYGENSLQAVPALINLAQVYVHQGNYAQAQPLFKRALSIVDKPDDDTLLPYLAVVETNFGAMSFAEGKFAVSEPHFKRAVSVATKSLGANHKWTTTIGAMHAACLKQLGKTKEAKAIERAAVAKANETQSPIFIWNRQIGLADEAMTNKKFPEAEAALKVALGASEKLTEEPMVKVVTLTRYGRFYLLQALPELAIEKLKEAQAIADVVLGLEDKSVLERAKQLADLEKTKGQYQDAEVLYQRLVTHAKKQFGPESEEYAKSLGWLASLYNSSGQYPQATTYYSKVLALLEKQFGLESEKLIPTLIELGREQNGRPYLQQADQKKPEEYLKRAANIATVKFGKDSKELVSVLDVFSNYYERHHEWSKAAKTYTQIIAANEKNFGPESPETVKALEQYAGVLQMQGLKNAADSIEARIAKIKGPKPRDD
jgi:tetratricopeptide (TPR) repeat protein